MIIDCDNYELDCAWDSSLKPIRDSQTGREAFPAWWDRCQSLVGHLHEQIAEQWIYRHWEWPSTYRNVPLEGLLWRLERWGTLRILSDLFVMPQFQFRDSDAVIKHSRTQDPGFYAPFKAKGTWDVPIIVIETPDGVRANRKRLKRVRFCLIEGHRRIECLWAWVDKVLQSVPDLHDVFVLQFR
jgi:hypothetical protein